MDSDLIEELYKIHYRSAYAYVFSLCLNREMTEDIVSHAFEKAILTIDYSVPNFGYWLIRVCRNLWIDMKRHEKRFFKTPIDELSIDSKINVCEEVIKNMENERLYYAVNCLNDIEKEILILFYFSDFSIKEISGLMHISISNAKVRLHRARLRLKKQMED